MTIEIKIGDIAIGGDNPLGFILGPCVIESEEQALRHAEKIQKVTSRLGVPFIYKSSFDKANRSSISSYRGVGLKEGIRILKKVKTEFGLPVLSDVHSVDQVSEVEEALDAIQIPAFLCRQTDLIVAAAKTGKVINVKKGQFMSPEDMRNVVEKIEWAGSKNILLTERGVTFGYNDLVVDMRSIPVMQGFGYPVVFDATHSCQLPGGLGKSSGGERRFASVLAKAAVAAGCDALFVEVHEDPDNAPCDGPNMLRLCDLEALLEEAMKINEVVRKK
ncbi:MAG: 3-deoxy-8-phosphooctulonate synthase [Candidatus Omnitrophota bacterium]